MTETTESFEIGAEQARALGSQLEQALNPRRAMPGALAAPEPVTWELDNGGMAWVWRVPGNDTLTNPVIIADGFSGGASKLEEWAVLWAEAGSADVYPWGSRLHEQGRDAARELLWKHTATHSGLGSTGKPFPADQRRADFVAALEALGSFPSKPEKLLAVANGRGDGQGLTDESGDPLEAGVKNLDWPVKPGSGLTPASPGAALYTQATGTDRIVAELYRAAGFGKITVKTSGIPALDGAPGGTLDSFALAAHALQDSGYSATVVYPDVCFVPVASAVDLAEPSDPFAPIEPGAAGGLSAFKVASQNEGHTLLTPQQCDWLTEQF